MRALAEHLRSALGLELQMLFSGEKMYWDADLKELAANFDKTLEELFVQACGAPLYEGKRYLTFEVSATTLDGADTKTPLVRYALN